MNKEIMDRNWVDTKSNFGHNSIKWIENNVSSKKIGSWGNEQMSNKKTRIITIGINVKSFGDNSVHWCLVED